MPSTDKTQPFEKVTYLASHCEHARSILLLIGLIGPYYKTTGSACSWALIALLLLQLGQLDIGKQIAINSLTLIAALSLGSLFSVNPMIALEGCGRIFLSMLFFIPGVKLGRRLSKQPIMSQSILPMTALYGSHFLFLRNHGDISFYGLSSNPNTVGQGLAYGLLLLLIISSAELTHWRTNCKSLHGITKPTAFRLAVISTTALAGTYLLIMANCRQGWLSIAAAAFTLCMLKRGMSKKAKLIIILSIGVLLATLVNLRDQKGFGYGSVGERLDLWSNSLQAWLTHFPLFGAGLGSFEQMAKYHHYGNITTAHRNPHNIVIELLFTGGIWAMMCIISYLVATGKDCFKGVISQPNSYISLASIAALIGLLTLGMLDMSFTSTRYMGSIAAVAGILYSQIKKGQSISQQKTKHGQLHS